MSFPNLQVLIVAVIALGLLVSLAVADSIFILTFRQPIAFDLGPSQDREALSVLRRNHGDLRPRLSIRLQMLVHRLMSSLAAGTRPAWMGPPSGVLSGFRS